MWYILLIGTAPGKTPLSWRTRIQIAIDVANALVISDYDWVVLFQFFFNVVSFQNLS